MILNMMTVMLLSIMINCFTKVVDDQSGLAGYGSEIDFTDPRLLRNHGPTVRCLDTCLAWSERIKTLVFCEKKNAYMDYRQVMLGYIGLIIAKLRPPSLMATVNFKPFMGTFLLWHKKMYDMYILVFKFLDGFFYRFTFEAGQCGK